MTMWMYIDVPKFGCQDFVKMKRIQSGILYEHLIDAHFHSFQQTRKEGKGGVVKTLKKGYFHL